MLDAAVEVLKVLLLALVGLFLLSTLLSHVFTWYYFVSYDRRFPTKGHAPPVSIIKSIKGVNQSALNNFRSFCEQDYPNDHEILFCVEGSQDPYVAVIQQAIQEYPDVEIGIVFSDPEDARSVGKLKDMIAGYGAISHDVLVFSDSDAHALPTFLREMLACTGSLRIGLGFGAPAYGGSEDWGAALIAVCANSFVLRLASMCLFGAFDEAVGTTMAVRRDVIEQIGGLQQFGRQVTDDLPLARAIRNEGYRIHLLKQPARIANRHYGFKRWWSHLHRWIMIIRHYWPNNFLITGVVDLAPWWALFYLALTLVDGSDAYPAVFLLAAVPGASVFSAAVLNTRFAGDEGFRRYLWVVSVLEFLRLPLLIYSGLTSVIVWRGRRLHTIPDCTTTMVAEHAGERAECRPPGRRG